VSTRKARDVIDGSDESHAADRTYSWDRHKTPAYWIVLSEVKNDPDLQSIPAVVLTASDTDGDVLASYTRHANAFVTKPLGLHPFETAVQQISRLFTHTSGADLRGSERYARLQATL